MNVLALAGAEARLLVRDRTLLISATAIPLLFAMLLTQNQDMFFARAAGPMAATQVILMLAFTTYAATSMALAGRRADLYLKRLRNSPLSDAGIITGLSLPLFVVTVLQIAVVLAFVTNLFDSMPARPELLAAAVLIGGVMCVGFAFLTAAYTHSPQAAQMTTMPLFVVFAVGAFWTVAVPARDVGPVQLLIPGGGVVQLARLGWEGVPGGDLAELLTMAGAATGGALVGTVAACLLAARLFSWEPRK